MHHTLIVPLQSWPSQMNLLVLQLTPCSSNNNPQVADAKSTSHQLKTPIFEWTTSDQYDEFKLFQESMESWFYLQAIPDECDDKSACLGYILDFLGTTSCWKWDQWTPASATADDIAATKKSANSSLDHLASQMDHTVSQQCQIYQLEDVWIKPGETPDKLVDCLRALANRCNYATDEEKEWNIKFCLVHTLTDSELVNKLLTLDLKATIAKILETWRTHIAIADNLNAMNLWSKTVNAVNKWSWQPQSHPQQQQQKTLNPQHQHACGNYTKIPCTWQSLLPCQGLHMLIMWKNWSLGHHMPKHLQ